MSYRDLLLEAEQTIQELEAKIKRLSLIDWKGLFETRVILLQKTEIKLNDAASRLAKAQDTINTIINYVEQGILENDDALIESPLSMYKYALKLLLEIKKALGGES